MSLDHLVTALTKIKKINLDINLETLLNRKFYHTQDSRDLYIIIPLSEKGLDYLFRLRTKIKKERASCLEYSLSSEILSTDTQKTLTHFYFIKQQIVNDIKKFKQQYKFTKIHLIGISMGCVTTLMIANHNSSINKIILLVPGSCLAESMWKSIKTQHLKRSIESRKKNLKNLKREWNSLAPKNNLGELKNKKIFIYLSRADKIIPSELGKHLVKAMRRKNLSPTVYGNKHLGHYGTIAKFCIFPNLET